MILESLGTELGLLDGVKGPGRSKIEVTLRSVIWTSNG
jgi:hypothetical protein